MMFMCGSGEGVDIDECSALHRIPEDADEVGGVRDVWAEGLTPNDVPVVSREVGEIKEENTQVVQGATGAGGPAFRSAEVLAQMRVGQKER